MDHKLKLEKRY